MQNIGIHNKNANMESYPKITTIHHECPCRMGKSHPRVGISTREEACQVPCKNSNPKGEISLSYMNWLMMDYISSTFSDI